MSQTLVPFSMKSNLDDRHDDDDSAIFSWLETCWKETSPKTGLHEGKFPKSLCQMERMQSYLRDEAELPWREGEKKQATSVNYITVKFTLV